MFDVNINVADGADDPGGFVHQPSGIRVGNQFVTGVQFGRDFLDSLDIDIGVATDFELKTSIALRRVTGDFFGHCFGRLLGNRPIQNKIFAESATHQIANTGPGRFAQQVPARHVDPRFDVGMPFQGRVHHLVERPQFSRFHSDQMGCQFLHPRAHPGRRPEGKTGPTDKPHRSRLAPDSVSISTIVLSNTSTDFPPDHL